MLQPLQLTDVSIRHAEEIVELRDFLIKAGCAVGSGHALGQIAARLRQDRAFHRDLTSHVWVVIDRCDRISYSDLLGVLAIAAAGPSLAATADEDDAHYLLRFLMEARHSLSGSDTLSDNEDRTPARGAADAMALGKGRENSDSGRRVLPWAVAAGCVFVALLIGLWLKSRPTEYAGNKPAPVIPGAAGNGSSTPATMGNVSPPALRPDDRAARAVAHSPIPPRNSRITTFPASRSSRRTPVAAASIPSPAPNGAPPAIAMTTHGPVPAGAPPAATPILRPSDSLTAPAHATRAVGTASAAQVGLPPATHIGPLGARSIPQDSAQQGGGNISSSSKAPILLRRRPPGSSPALSEDGTNLASEASPPDVSAALGSGINGRAGTTRGGTVHGTSLGAMASSLLYCPMPAYPAAASASHVQGEVKLSADVDRDGKVASVRVISGPPLLRDAALEAVQRWRYRPYLSSGGPIPMAAIEILDFQLP